MDAYTLRIVALMLTASLSGGMLLVQMPELILASYRTIHFHEFKAIDLPIQRIEKPPRSRNGGRNLMVVLGHDQGQVLRLRKSEVPEMANNPAPESMVGRTIRILYRPGGSMYRMNDQPLAVAPFRERRTSFVADGAKALLPSAVFGLLALGVYFRFRRLAPGGTNQHE